MIVEVIMKYRYEMSEDVRNRLEEEEDYSLEKAIMNGEAQVLSAKMEIFEDGELIDDGELGNDDFKEYIRDKDEA